MVSSFNMATSGGGGYGEAFPQPDLMCCSQSLSQQSLPHMRFTLDNVVHDALCRMYWANPLSYAIKALVVNEFDSPRWDKPLPTSEASQVLN
jgi:hypothetical protein